MGKRLPRKFKYRKVSKRTELWYTTQLRAFVKQMREDVEKALQVSRGAFFMDSEKDDKGMEAFSVRAFLDFIKKYKNEEWTDNLANNLSRQFAARANQQNQQEIADNLKRQIGVDIERFVFGGNKVAQRLEGLMLANTQLIKSIPTQYLDKVQSAVTRGLVSGKLPKDIAEEIKEIGRITDSRARLIARDQSSKASSALTQARHEELGITRYRWSASGDERVRESHMANDGKIFSYDNPPPTGHPGHEVNCRCVAIAVFDGVNDKPIDPEIAQQRIDERYISDLFENKNDYLDFRYYTSLDSDLMSAATKHKLTIPELMSVRQYTKVDFHKRLNNRLWAGRATKADKNYISVFRKALDKLPVHQSTVWRSIDLSAEQLSRYTVGAVVEELGFTSTSRDRNLDKFKGNVRFTIHSKDGKMVDELSSFPVEKEVLFKNGTKFFVRDVKKHGNLTHIELWELIEW